MCSEIIIYMYNSFIHDYVISKQGNSQHENDENIKCSETYAGSDAASELETKHITNYFRYSYIHHC